MVSPRRVQAIVAVIALSLADAAIGQAAAGLAVFPLVLVTHPSVQASSVRELVTLARQSPGTLNFASAGSGGGAHLAAETFRVATGIEVVHVPYKGTGPAVAGILGGQVAFMFASIPSVIGHVRAGKLNALAVSSAGRSGAGAASSARPGRNSSRSAAPSRC